ncbi:MAG: peptidoglycan bridge formation glycyltransferase FemA/FemB family protein [Chloroflexia bacterium]|nr:peptidoglycan bridge formation glycyltransferase FemA/FemB family protein [Chloroflexia bacterium]
MTARRNHSEVGAKWDSAIARLDGDLLQSWRWGVFKQRHGWHARHVWTTGSGREALAQVLFRRFGPFSIAYLPRGPVMSNPASDNLDLLHDIDDVCQQNRAIVLVIEPNQPLPDAWFEQSRGFVRGPAAFQSARTVRVDLLDDDRLLAQMRKDTRYNISYAQRHETTIDRAASGDAQIDMFYRLLRETSQRNGFGIHSQAYYKDFLETFGDQAVLFFARVNDVVTAGQIAVRVGGEARSMYAGSTRSLRTRGDTALLQFATMQWARDHGCTRYDMGGIAPESPASGSNQDDARTGSDLVGVHQFKTGFGGHIVAYPETVERRYRPHVSWLMRRLNARFRAAPEQALGSAPETN